MAGDDLLLDPITKDYVDDGAGGWTLVTTAQMQMHHALLDEFDRWVGDPDAGSKVHRLARRGATAITAQLAAAYVKEALAPLVAEGRIADLQVAVARDDRNRLIVTTSARDVASGAAIALVVPVSHGA